MNSPESADATALALLRVVVAGLLITSPEVWTPMALEATHAALRTPPEGLAWLSLHAPITPTLITAARAVVGVAATVALVGFQTRTAFAVLAAAGFYLFGCAELVGATRHGMHLWWFSVLLAVSPCGASLSVDALRGRGRPDPRAVFAAVWAARALLAVVYFFPGYWKLRSMGLDWALGDNLRNQMYWKWFQNAWIPAFRVDAHPTLLHAGALGVVALEVGFPLLVLTRRGRLLAALGGLAFHLFADASMRLGFASLWWCYVVLIDWRPIVAWLHDEPRNARDERADELHGELPGARGPGARTIAVVGGALLVANGVQGFRGAVQAWPFACYPTFQYVAGAAMPDLLVTAVAEDGKESALIAGTRGVVFRSQLEWGIVWKAMGLYGGPVHAETLTAYYAYALREGAAASVPDGTRRLRFYRAEFSTLPEDRGKSPLRVDLLADVTPP